MKNMKKTMYGMATITIVVALAGFAILSAPARADIAGEATHKAKCAGCHGSDGKGQTAVGKVICLTENIEHLRLC